MKKELMILGISVLVAIVLAVLIGCTKYYHWMLLTILIPVITGIYLSIKRAKNKKK
ncbi:hypothetical protein [uncultured Lactobacillus sp.]|uniref:hypothetical protein n=1 Tax=uncultured Lactobacillus sp. TaxID=153152 RepID=UPI00262A363F|nr:hypothetical protein [uncultured Lactobacillus sp.]